ncbi:MAG TPA: 3'(2'),5'-bisphosphate nucleotidase CysQ [Candidatus Polarisedimenticolia bacterium]|nr:3'(2'),5'-bisphosphate nucleotidase CysQ [Candidatus Polarisedimenticolia bacterium]
MGSQGAEAVGRIRAALTAATAVLAEYTPGAVAVERKAGGDPVTAADRRVNEALHRLLLRDDEGWLSEETIDDGERLRRSRVWIVDPLDGTREFIQGIPEWCVSIALVEDGRLLAGGICNPAAGQTFLGSLETGVTLNDAPVLSSRRTTLAGATVLASRSEVTRGEWARYRGTGFNVKPVGSVAYKLALVAAGLADATWTLTPKHEWDVAAGAALVAAAGGRVMTLTGEEPSFNHEDALLTGLIAAAPGLAHEVSTLLQTSQHAH